MFKPCLPVILKPEEGDDRVRFAGAFFCSRERGVKLVPEDQLRLELVFREGDAVAFSWAARAKTGKGGSECKSSVQDGSS